MIARRGRSGLSRETEKGRTVGRLDGKVAIITGASRGTGESTARLFAEEGARVIVADVLEEEGRQVVSDLGDAAAFVAHDVTSEDSWQRCVAATEQQFGRIDVLVNNAAVLLLSSLVDTQVEDFDRVVSVNQRGVFLGIKSVAEPMKRLGRGSIVNVASVDGMKGQPGVVAYASTKWAVRGITRVAALELGQFGIRVNAVCPEAGGPGMVSPFIPDGVDMEKVMAAQQTTLAYQRDRTIADRLRDVAHMIAFLASDESLSCSGTDFLIDSGNAAGRAPRGAR